MSLLQPAEHTTAYLKAGILGFAGAGKTHTAMLLAIGLAKLMAEHRKERPVIAMQDTEFGSDYWIERLAEQEINFLTVKSRTFRDTLTFISECEKSAHVGVIDSITHIWSEFMEAWAASRNITELQIYHWAPLKKEWRQFTDRYLNSRVHLIMAGRATWEWDMQQRDDGKKELIKVGTKMRAEGDLGYEPSLLIEMEKIKNPDKKIYINRAIVLKDRNDLINGTEIDMPKFSDFAPVIEKLNIGGEHMAVNTEGSSRDMFDSPDTSYGQRAKEAEIVLEEIQNLFIKNDLGGTAQDVKKKKIATMERAMGTAAWTKIKDMRLKDLKHGLRRLEAIFAGEDPDKLEEQENGNGKPEGAPKVDGPALEQFLKVLKPKKNRIAEYCGISKESLESVIAKMALADKSPEELDAIYLDVKNGNFEAFQAVATELYGPPETETEGDSAPGESA